MNKVGGIVFRAVEPLARQLLGTLKPSMVALRLLPAGEGTSNRIATDSSRVWCLGPVDMELIL